MSRIVCPACKGEGSITISREEPCGYCDGIDEECGTCGGSGIEVTYDEISCDDCSGEGYWDEGD